MNDFCWQEWLSEVFPSKHACLAFCQLRLLGELVVVTMDRGVFGFLLLCTLQSENFVIPCGVIRRVFIFLATSDAILYGVFATSILITPSLCFSV